MSKKITKTEKLISEMIRTGEVVKVNKDGSYSRDWSKATKDIYNFVLMVSDTKMEVTIKKEMPVLKKKITIN